MRIDDLNKYQYRCIKRAVGINYNVNQQGNFYKNRYLVNPKTEVDLESVQELVDNNIFERIEPPISTPFWYLKLTEKGIQLAQEIEKEIYEL